MNIEAPPPPKVEMKISLDGKPLNGVDIQAHLTLTTDSPKTQELTLKMNAQIMKYTNIPEAGVWTDTRDVQLQPKKGIRRTQTHKINQVIYLAF